MKLFKKTLLLGLSALMLAAPLAVGIAKFSHKTPTVAYAFGFDDDDDDVITIGNGDDDTDTEIEGDDTSNDDVSLENGDDYVDTTDSEDKDPEYPDQGGGNIYGNSYYYVDETCVEEYGYLDESCIKFDEEAFVNDFIEDYENMTPEERWGRGKDWLDQFGSVFESFVQKLLEEFKNFFGF